MKNTMPTNVPGLLKEKNGVMVINTNVGQYKTILAKRKKIKEEKQFQTEVIGLKKEVAELSTLVAQLIKNLEVLKK